MTVEWADALVEVIEKAALLRQQIDRAGDQTVYAARVNRLAAKVDALRARIGETDPALADAIAGAWQRPIRTLAFRNAQHQRERDDEG